MADVYRLLRLSTWIKNKRIKLFGIWTFHMLGKRYIGVFLDPVLACNFRCKMCYFSDAEKRKTYKGILSYTEIEQIAGALFHRALKLQIGCGAEPTLHRDLTQIIALGKQYGIPYISLTTNGGLLTRDSLENMIKAGLNEITLSVHGLTEKTYEELMVNGKFDTFRQIIHTASALRKQYNGFKIRINYTINEDNLEELCYLWDILGEDFDILQLRPIQKIGKSAYTNFDLSQIYAQYDMILAPLIKTCKEKGIVCIAPSKENIIILENNEETDQSFVDATYCYVSPQGCWKDGFDFRTDTFESFSKKNQWSKQLWKNIFKRDTNKKTNVTRKMNYNIN